MPEWLTDREIDSINNMPFNVVRQFRHQKVMKLADDTPDGSNCDRCILAFNEDGDPGCLDRSGYVKCNGFVVAGSHPFIISRIDDILGE